MSFSGKETEMCSVWRWGGGEEEERRRTEVDQSETLERGGEGREGTKKGRNQSEILSQKEKKTKREEKKERKKRSKQAVGLVAVVQGQVQSDFQHRD